MTMTSVTPAEAQRMIQDGAKLIDIRDPDEHAREHIPGADNVPLAEIDRLQAGNCPVVFHCRSGARTGANAARLVAATGAPCYVLEGGLDAWRRAGLEVAADRRHPLELMRPVPLAPGGLALLGVAHGFLVGPGFFAHPPFVRAALILPDRAGWARRARPVAP